MENKKWYKSKTIWSGVVAVLIAGYNAAAISFNLPVVPEFVYGILASFGIYSRVTANTVITK